MIFQMAFDPADFVSSFPEFSDSVKYPAGTLTFWSGVATLRLNEERWGELLTFGTYLFVAHQISLSELSVSAATVGINPSRVGGLVSNKGVGDVSVGYDNSSIVEDDGGNYNATRYGREFLRLARIVGIGGVQIT